MLNVMAAAQVREDERRSEEYIISETKKILTEQAAAKAWIITAKSMFPDSFYVQYEVFKMEQNYNNVKIAATYFCDLIEKFQNEPGLHKEMKHITDALRSTSNDGEIVFLKKLFKCLSNNTKYKILSTVASHSEDAMEHCRVMLLLLQELPNQLLEHGGKVIDTLMHAENLSQYNRPMNPFRKLLVCDAMPTILFSSNLKVPSSQLCYLMQSAVEFYICHIFGSEGEEFETELLKDKYDHWKCSSNNNDNVLNVWKPLFSLLKAGGQQLHWSLIDLFSSRVSFLYELSWEKIMSIIQKKMQFNEKNKINAPENGYDKEVFLCTAVLYFYCLYQFSKLVGPRFFSKSDSNDDHYVLIQGIRPVEEDFFEPLQKRLRLDSESNKVEKLSFLSVSKAASPDIADNLTQSFITAVKLWEVLNKQYLLSKDFSALCDILQMECWPCFREFFIDMLIYQGCHKEAISHLMLVFTNTKDEFIKNKTRLQLASSLYFVKEYVNACEYIFDVVSGFSSVMSVPSDEPSLTGSNSSSRLHFIAFNPVEILQFCVELLIDMYKQKIIQSPVTDNLLFGHLLVLCQCNWPLEEEIFLYCINHIRQTGSFCFSKFFDYIIVPDILEEFMFLTTTAGGSVTLDLLPTSTMQVGKQRAVTRGVNKGAKEDLRGTMKKQMARCDENLDELLISFIKQERHYIKMVIL